jgi:hypothetical protein
MSDLKAKLIRGGSRAALVLRKYSPEILLGVGITGGVAATVLACKATLKAQAVTEEFHKDMSIINDAKSIALQSDDPTVYPEEAETQDKVRAYTKAGVGMAKVYGPAFGVGVAAISCVLASHGIMKRRQVALFAAFAMVQEGFANYRRRVVEDAGTEKDDQYRYGIAKEPVEEKDGKTVSTEKTDASPSYVTGTDYARNFDESNHNYRPDLEMNVYFIKAVQSYLNDQLRINGHVFLNDAYRQLGFPDSKAGAIVGWVYEAHKGDGDNYIDLKLHSHENMSGRSIPSILVDFNVDGIIFDMI